MNFTSNFNNKGYGLAKDVFPAEFISELVLGFDRIVKQLEESGETINARWGSELTQNIEANDLYDNGITHLNIGTGEDISIKNLSELIAEIVGFKGTIIFDKSMPDGTFRKLLCP